MPLADGPSEFEPLLFNYPNEWAALYIDKKYWTVDATVRFSSCANTPFSWGAMVRLTRAEQSLFAEAHDVGIRDGLTVPIHYPSGELVSVSFARSRSDALPPETIYQAQMLASLLTLRCREIRGEIHLSPPPKLTERERECLAWAAIGKSSWDIGKILSVSADTVNFHVKNAMRKLDCSSRILAVVKAIRCGLIRP